MTVGIVVAAASGTVALTAVASDATPPVGATPSSGTADLVGQPGTSDQDGAVGVVPAPSTRSSESDDAEPAPSPRRPTVVEPAPAPKAPQAGTNAS